MYSKLRMNGGLVWSNRSWSGSNPSKAGSIRTEMLFGLANLRYVSKGIASNGSEC